MKITVEVDLGYTKESVEEIVMFVKDNIDTHECYDSSSGLYIIPITGIYQIEGTMLKYAPTGKFETMPNWRRRWWQFWVPKTILQEKMNIETIRGGCETKWLKAGDTIKTDFALRL